MRILTFLLMFAFIISGCGQKESNVDGEKGTDFIIYTSIYPLQYFAERIGGDSVKVESIIPPGSDGHTYEPTTKELINISKADLLIYNGAGFEGFVGKAKKSLESQDVSFLNASAHITEDESEHEDGHEDEHHEHGDHEHGEIDPHLWLDPVYAIEMAHTIKDEMIKQRPEKKEEFEANFKALKSDLAELDQKFEELAENAQRKEFIVAHSAYGNWEERYGLKQISVAGTSPSHEPSQKEAQAIIDFAQENDVPYILFEKNITSNVAKMIQKDVDAEALYLSNLESLTEEQMDQNEDYLRVMEENLTTLKKALNSK
ncbi:metal ABC transporter solute-binding protein, Zn/Mn family [Alkalihalobacillus sp. TS-13]|uniref:metal ABC transporter solute-binding protein, Zn/Mn family n=1 Tax=Alkalihalobacillus sp. TS-13 TaxID=2842455 RepID=UPI0021A9F944|nr:zinc ABC transporter substrate-binding protein [Alkalihalobacillus sp. TS-13]